MRPLLQLRFSTLPLSTAEKDALRVGMCANGNDNSSECIVFTNGTSRYAFDIAGIRVGTDARQGICKLTPEAGNLGYTDYAGEECAPDSILLILSAKSDLKPTASIFAPCVILNPGDPFWEEKKCDNSNRYSASTLRISMQSFYDAVKTYKFRAATQDMSQLRITRDLKCGSSKALPVPATWWNNCYGDDTPGVSFYPPSTYEVNALWDPQLPGPPVYLDISVSHNTTTNQGNVTYNYSFQEGNTGDTPITSYQYCVTTSASCSPNLTLPTGSVTSGSFSPLAYNAMYRYCVRAVNRIGSGNDYACSDAARGYTIPAAISSIGATYQVNTHSSPQINITKSATSGDAALGGNAATFGKYSYSTDNGSTWMDASGSFAWGTTSIPITYKSSGDALAPDTAYQVCLRVSNLQAGENNFSLKSPCVSVTTGKLTVQFDKNLAQATGTMLDQIITTNSDTQLNENAYIGVGYAFDGWALTPSGSAAYADKAWISPASADFASDTVMLYAQFVMRNLDISINLNGGVCSDGVAHTLSFTKGYNATVSTADLSDETMTCQAPTKSDANGTWTFDGFYGPTEQKITLGVTPINEANGARESGGIWSIELTAKYKWQSTVTYYSGVADNGSAGSNFGSADNFSMEAVNPANYALRGAIPDAPASCLYSSVYQSCRFDGWKISSSDVDQNDQVRAPGVAFTPKHGAKYEVVAQWTPLTLSAISDSSGASTGGHTFSIFGAGLSPEASRVGSTFTTQVMIGSSQCASISFVSAAEISCTTSVHAVQSSQDVVLRFDWGSGASASPGTATSRYASALLTSAYDYTTSVTFDCNQDALQAIGATANAVDAGAETCTNSTLAQVYKSSGVKTLPAASISTTGSNMPGIEFLGWSLNASASAATWADGANYNVSSSASGHINSTLYAIWAKKAYTAGLQNGKYKYTQSAPLTAATANVTPAGNITGSISSTTPSSQATSSALTFSIGDTITLAANPVAGYHFTNWSIVNLAAASQTYATPTCFDVTTASPCDITITNEVIAALNGSDLFRIEANYAPDRYSFTLNTSVHISGYCSNPAYNNNQSGCGSAGGTWQAVNAGNQGSVDGSATTATPSTSFTDTPDTRFIEYGDTINVVCSAGTLENCATFSLDYQLGGDAVEVDGVGDVSSKTASIQMPNSNLAVQTRFINMQYELSVTAWPEFGSLIYEDNQVMASGKYIDINRNIDLEAIAASGWTFDHWEITACTNSAGVALPLANCDTIANFASTLATTTLNVVGSGNVTIRANFIGSEQTIDYNYLVDSPALGQGVASASQQITSNLEALYEINPSVNAAADLNTGYALQGFLVTAPLTSPLYGKYFAIKQPCSGVADGFGSHDASSLANAACAFRVPDGGVTLTAQYAASVRPIIYSSNGVPFLGSFAGTNTSTTQTSSCNAQAVLNTLPATPTLKPAKSSRSMSPPPLALGIHSSAGKSTTSIALRQIWCHLIRSPELCNRLRLRLKMPIISTRCRKLPRRGAFKSRRAGSLMRAV